MGIAFQLRDEFSANAQQIGASMRQLDANSMAMASKLNQSMNMVRGGFAAVAAGAALLAPSISALSKAGDYEVLDAAMGAMLKSKKIGQDTLNALDQFAASTPFNIEPVRQAGRMLVGFGQDASKVVPTLKLLGNVAAGVGIDIAEMAEVYGRNLQQSHLYMRDIWQMALRGIPIIQTLAKNMGVASDEIQGMVEKGMIGIPEMEEAFRTMGSGAGQFANLMEIISKTMKGAWSNIQDAGYLAMQAWGLQLLPLVKAVIPFISSLVRSFTAFAKNPLGGAILKLVSILGVFLVVGGIVAILMGGLRLAGYSLLRMFGDLTRATLAKVYADVGLRAGLWATTRALWANVTAAAAAAAPYLAAAAALYVVYRAMSSGNRILIAFGGALAFALFFINPFLGAIAAVVAVFTFFNDAIDRFNNASATGPHEGGVIGYLQRLGGVLVAVGELWSSWDAKTGTMSLSENLYNKLNSMGILDTVLAISTWIARIRTFLSGLAEGFVYVFQVIRNVGKSLWESIQPVAEALGVSETSLSKFTSSLKDWKKYGQEVGFLLGILVVVLLALAVAWVAAFWPLFAGIAALVILWEISKKLAEWFQKMGDAIWRWATIASDFTYVIRDMLSGWWDSIVAFGDRMYEAGKNWILNLVRGMRDAIPVIKALLTSMAMAFPMLAPVAAAIPDVTTSRSSNIEKTSRNVAATTMAGRGPLMSLQNAAPAKGGSTTRHIHVNIGGEHLTSFIDRHDQDDDDRTNE